MADGKESFKKFDFDQCLGETLIDCEVSSYSTTIESLPTMASSTAQVNEKERKSISWNNSVYNPILSLITFINNEIKMQKVCN